MDTQPTSAPGPYDAPPPTADPAQVRTAYRIAAWVVLALSVLAIVGAVVLSGFAATDPGEYSSLGYLFALFLLAPVVLALAALGLAHRLRHRSPVASLVLACIAAGGLSLLAVNVVFFLLPV